MHLSAVPVEARGESRVDGANVTQHAPESESPGIKKGIADALRAPVVYVTGKGGVGKSTIAAAIAVAMSRAGKRAALVEFDDDEAGGRSLEGEGASVTHVDVTLAVRAGQKVRPDVRL